jgi:hypothetical protein
MNEFVASPNIPRTKREANRRAPIFLREALKEIIDSSRKSSGFQVENRVPIIDAGGTPGIAAEILALVRVNVFPLFLPDGTKRVQVQCDMNRSQTHEVV